MAEVKMESTAQVYRGAGGDQNRRRSSAAGAVQMKKARISLGDLEKLGKLKLVLPQCHVTLVRCDPQVPERQRRHLLPSAPFDATSGGGGRRYKCDLCPKNYSSNSALTQHKRVHLDKNCYRCRICGKRHNFSSQLKQHLKTHDRNFKRIQCTDCDLSFMTRIEMISHARQHTGEKPFRCSVCGKRYASLAPLKKHAGTVQDCKLGADQYLRKDRPQVRFRCRVCHQTFALKEDLSYHLDFHWESSSKKES